MLTTRNLFAKYLCVIACLGKHINISRSFSLGILSFTRNIKFVSDEALWNFWIFNSVDDKNLHLTLVMVILKLYICWVAMKIIYQCWCVYDSIYTLAILCNFNHRIKIFTPATTLLQTIWQTPIKMCTPFGKYSITSGKFLSGIHELHMLFSLLESYACQQDTLLDLVLSQKNNFLL